MIQFPGSGDPTTVVSEYIRSYICMLEHQAKYIIKYYNIVLLGSEMKILLLYY